MADDNELSLERLKTFGLLLAKSRSEAISGRENCGIEQEWVEDEEYVEGIDDANRHEIKSSSKRNIFSTVTRDINSTSSTIFPNITRRYCEGSSSRVVDIAIPTNGSNWSMQPTPIPDLVEISAGKFPAKIERQIKDQVPQELWGETKEEIVYEIALDIKEAEEKAKKAQRRIEDWHAQCQFNSQLRQVIEDSSKTGTGVLKGPFPKRVMNYAFVGGRIQRKEDISPASKRVDYWNCFPDPACGENIHNGSYFWERDDISRKELLDLVYSPGYIKQQIISVLEEGPKKATKEYDPDKGKMGVDDCNNKNIFEIWYFHGQIEKADIEASGMEVDDEMSLVFAQVTIVNNTVIRAVLNPLDTGEFPYDFMPWRRRSGSPWGISEARTIRPAQRMIVGASRNMMDNAGLAGGPMWIVDTNLVEPLNGVYEIAPRKGWKIKKGVELKSINDAFRFIEIPMIQERLEAVIALGLRFAEELSGLPLIAQGQQGQATDTVGGMEILNDNASAVLRSIARTLGNVVVEPHIRRYYSYLMQYGEDDEEKGDFIIDVSGPIAMIERGVRNQKMFQFGNFVANPIYGKDPKKWFDEVLIGSGIDPKRLDYDDDEWRQIVEQMSQQPQDQSLAVAQMNNETKERIKAFELQADQAESDKQRAFDAAMKEIDVWLNQQEQSGNQSVELDKLRAKLTENREKLQTQIMLNGTQALTPPVEPKGQAEPGKAFAQ